VFDDTLLTEEVITIFTPSEGVDGGGLPHLDIGSRAEVTGGMGGIEPGLAPNAAGVVGYMFPGGGIMEAANREWHTEYSLDTTTRVIQTGPGWVDPDRSTAAVTVVTERRVCQALWMSDVPDGEAYRTQDDWGRFREENTRPRSLNSSFDEFEYWHTQAAAALGIPLDNVHLMVMERIIPMDIYVRVWDIPTILMVAVLLLLLAMLLFGLLRRQKAAGEDEESLEPQLAVEDLLVSTQLEEAREEEAAQLEEIDYHKENEIKKHIEKFVNEKPESVAALLRNWINVEEW
jgi:flagellar M-ring protein FliF